MNVKKLLDMMIDAGREIVQPTGNHRQFRGSTNAKKYRNPARQNHGKGESKARRKMAAKSRRINRGK